MANTYIRIYVHVVFAVKYRDACIARPWRDRLYAYMAAIIKNKGQYPIKIGGTHNHVHLLFSYNGKIPMSDLVRDIKTGTTHFIKENKFLPCRFAWQKGYACLSYSQSHVEAVARYIENQEQHHATRTVRDEIKTMLLRYKVDFDEEYILSEPE